MAKPDYRLGTLICTIIAGVFTVISVLLILAALIWQGLIVLMPVYNQSTGEINCVQQVARREGFTHSCYTASLMDEDVNSPKNPCVPLDYVVAGMEFPEDDADYIELTELRRTSMILVVVAIILGVIGFILLMVFIGPWLRAADRQDFSRVQRFMTGLCLLFAGLSCNIGLVFLHLTYTREKVLKTNRLQLIYTSWDTLFGTEFQVSYSHSYWMLVTSVPLLEIAGIIVMIAGHLSHLLGDMQDGSMGEIHFASKYAPILQRYKTEDQASAQYDSYDPAGTSTPDLGTYQ